MTSQNNFRQPTYNNYSDQQGGTSIREILYRIFSRFYLFLACVIIVPMLTVCLVSLIPQQYEAKAKILIRHNDTSSFSETSKSPSKNTSMSSQSIVEILTSLPVCEKVVENMNIQASDIAKPSYKIILSYLAQLYYYFFPPETENGSATAASSYSLLAKDFEKSIFPQITDKGPGGYLTNDELIEVRIRSFNHQAVASITNNLSEEFINEYYRIFEEDAQRTYRYLSRQIAIAEGSALKSGSVNTPTTHNQNNEPPGEEWVDSDVTMNPIVAKTSRQIAEIEKELFHLRTIYSNNSVEVKQMKAELADAKQRLKTYKNQESTESILNALKEKRRQAFMNLQVYQNRLVPISIVERAITPAKSSMTAKLRYVTAGGFGLVTGLSLGFTIVMFLGAIDNRLFTPWDIEKISDIEILGSITEDRKAFEKKKMFADITQLKISNAAIETLGRLDLKTRDYENILMVTGAANGEGKSAVALQIACALAHDQRTRVLLIDANFSSPDLSNGLLHKKENSLGLIDLLTGNSTIDKLIQKTDFENLDFLPTGNVGQREFAGFYRKSLHIAMENVRKKYDLIIVDTAGLLKSVGATLFASEVNHILMVVKAGVTRRETFLNSQNTLKRVDDKIIGAILNFRNHPVPRFFYGKE